MTKNNIYKKEGLPYFDNEGWLRNTHHFSAAAQHKLKYGRYTLAPIKSKEWVDFWDKEYLKCFNGVTIGEITITGYHYFYLNYYPMEIVTEIKGVKTRKQGFPSFWFIDWQFFRIIDYCINNGLHFGGIKTRGVGYSEKFASMGARDLNLVYRDEDESPLFKRSFYFATNDGYLGGGDGIITKVFNAADYLNNETDGRFQKSYHLNDKVASYEREAGIITKDNTRIKTGGLVVGRVIDKVDKIRGSRGNSLFFEEAGTNRDLVKGINIARPLVEGSSGADVFGTIYVWGTSNADSKNVEGLKQVIYNPNGFNMIKFHDVWSNYDGAEITADFIKSIPHDPLSFIIPKEDPRYIEKGSGVGWFVPSYYSAIKDKDGNPLIADSLKILLETRKSILSGQSEEDAMSYIADHPFLIKEALLRAKGKEFNYNQLVSQLVNLETGLTSPKIYRGYFTASINKATNTIERISFVEDSSGHVKIAEMPRWAVESIPQVWTVDLSNTEIQSKLYIGGIDSIDQGRSDSANDDNNSKLGFLIKKRIDPDDSMNYFNGKYILEYIHRPDDVREAYLQVAYANFFFNAISLLEYSKISIVNYYDERGWSSKILASEPDAPGTTISSYKANKKRRGIRINQQIVQFGINKIHDYLKDENEIVFYNLIKQLIDYTKEEKTRFDLIAAMALVEILESEYINVLPQSNRKVDQNKFNPPKWYFDGKRWRFGSPKTNIGNFGFGDLSTPSNNRYLDKHTKKWVTYES